VTTVALQDGVCARLAAFIAKYGAPFHPKDVEAILIEKESDGSIRGQVQCPVGVNLPFELPESLEATAEFVGITQARLGLPKHIILTRLTIFAGLQEVTKFAIEAHSTYEPDGSDDADATADR
jgi:hypothetical protein